MPNVLIAYYSRSGTTQKLALALASALDADVVEIRCKRYGPGIFNYLRAGYDSVKGNLPPIELSRDSAQDYDLVLLGAPIWTSYPALPLRAFLAGKPRLPPRVALFLTYGGHSPPETAVNEVEALLPVPVEASLLLRSKEVREDVLPDKVAEFTATLTR